jgi:hypothetical protein
MPRHLANMILVASPALFDDPEARLFLEEVQRLAGTKYGALALHKLSTAPAAGGGDGTAATLRAGRSKNGCPREPADGSVIGQGQILARRPRRPDRSTARSGRGPHARKISER